MEHLRLGLYSSLSPSERDAVEFQFTGIVEALYEGIDEALSTVRELEELFDDLFEGERPGRRE
jgi:hypothetical protein